MSRISYFKNYPILTPKVIRAPKRVCGSNGVEKKNKKKSRSQVGGLFAPVSRSRAHYYARGRATQKLVHMITHDQTRLVAVRIEVYYNIVYDQ